MKHVLRSLMTLSLLTAGHSNASLYTVTNHTVTKKFNAPCTCGKKNLACCSSKSKKLDTIIASLKLKSACADYIIVGLGTAGTVLARYLSDNINNKVLVLEAGKNYSHDPVILNANNPFAPSFSAKYTRDIVVHDPTIPALLDFSNGRTWGGSSAIYWLFMQRGSADRYNDWAVISGNPRWTYNNLLPFMKFLEKFVPDDTIPNLKQRGVHGPIVITQEPPVNNLPLAQATSRVTGAPLVPDNNDVSLGVSANQLYLKRVNDRSIRSFASNAFLPPSVVSPTGKGVGNRQLTIISSATVTKILFKGNKAIGVEYILDNNKEQIRRAFAKKKVIVCAGAVSPALLQLSGIGDAMLLQRQGINVLVNNPNVGRSLQVHYGAKAVIKGALPQGFTAFINLNRIGKIRKYQLLVLPGSFFVDPGIITSLNLTNQPIITVSAYNMRPKSKGSILIPNNDPLTFPLVNYNLYSDGGLNDPGSDASEIVRVFKIIKHIADNAGLELAYPPVNHYPPIGSDQQLFEDAKASVVVTDHFTATCKMGTSITNGVVDGNLHVFGVENLMVADNSIAPVPATGNTGWQAYVIGIIAAHILGFQLP